MSIVTVLEKSQAFSSGSDLWIFPDHEECPWTSMADWRTGFRLFKYRNKSVQPLSENLQSIVTECQLTVSQGQETPHHLLLASHAYFPNIWSMLVPASERPEIWLNTIHNKWQQLSCPSLRIFLPKTYQIDSFKIHFNGLHEGKPISIVPSQ